MVAVGGEVLVRRWVEVWWGNGRDEGVMVTVVEIVVIVVGRSGRRLLAK